MAIAKFAWSIGEKPPPLKSHSGAKLRLIKNYLDSYFAAVVRNPTIDRLRITLVDGFCGGGAFDDRGLLVDGTPILLLNAVRDAEMRLNQGKSKPIKIDAQFHFIDSSKKTTDYLKEQLVQGGHLSRLGADIFVHTSSFENVSAEIIETINHRTSGGAGRSLFLLDQKGYTAAPLATIRSIFSQFRRAECILTFAVDWLIDYLSERPESVAAVSPVELSPTQVREFLSYRGDAGGRYMIQRLLLRHLQDRSGAEFATPFFIRSQEAKKALWLVHLSRHATARNVMVDSHWAVKNHSIHQGRGGLEINGFDPDYKDVPDFMFEDHERHVMNERLAEDMVRRIRDKHGHDPVSYGLFVDSIANETPARLSDIDGVISTLSADKELSVTSKAGNTKRTIKPSRADLVAINRQQRIVFAPPR